MTLGSGCGSKTLIRIGGGNLKSLVVYVFLGIAAYMTLRGLIGAFRVGVLEKASLALAPGQDLPSLAAAIGFPFGTIPADGATVPARFTVKFGLEGYRIGKLKDRTPGTGHHHVLINSGPVPKGEPIPVNEQSKHYGTGLTEAILNLPPGEHRLTLQFGDGEHESYGPQASHTITVRVR